MLKRQFQNSASCAEMTDKINALLNSENSLTSVINNKTTNENTDPILFEWLADLVEEVVYIDSSSIMSDAYFEYIFEGFPHDLLPDFLKNNETSPQINSIQQVSDMADYEQHRQSFENQFAPPIDFTLIPNVKNVIPRPVGRFKWREEVLLIPSANKTDLPLTLKIPVVPLSIPLSIFSLEDFRKWAFEKHIDLNGVNLADVNGELTKRINLLSGMPFEGSIWPPLQRHARSRYFNRLSALFALCLFSYRDDIELAVALMFCISKFTTKRISRNFGLIIKEKF